MEDSPEWIAKLAESKNANQIFVVAGIGETTAYVSMHQKDENGKWKTVVTTPGYIGKKGLGKTKEGDAMTPVGTFHFNKAFGIAENPGCALEYQKVSDDDWWSGDANYKYNQYQYCLNVSYNEEGTAGRGSAIFLHCLGPYKPYTGGCIAIPKAEMEKVMKNVDKDCVVVIDSLKNLSPETWADWGL